MYTGMVLDASLSINEVSVAVSTVKVIGSVEASITAQAASYEKAPFA
jgi:hypothetical protein